MNEYFEELGRQFADAASREGAAIEPPTLDPAVARELLDLARVVAHTGERRFAPLSTFVAGIAAERLRASFGAAEPEQVAQMVREVWQALEQNAAESRPRPS